MRGLAQQKARGDIYAGNGWAGGSGVRDAAGWDRAGRDAAREQA